MNELPLIVPGEVIACAGDLAEHPSLKFRVQAGAYAVEAFLIRFKGEFFAYRNRCAHAGTPLDWTPNEFFDETGDLLLCRTHGALFEAGTGRCAGGPCAGRGLERIPIRVSAHGEIRLGESG